MKNIKPSIACCRYYKSQFNRADDSRLYVGPGQDSFCGGGK
ncbi:hypothetical protein [Mucilaginibacter frigoritolerans]|nr:hypothetical protein [Mucilaginibacter frigoritolerans]